MSLILDHRGNPISSEAVSPLYEGGSTAARMGTWGLSGAGPNVGSSGMTNVRRRARQMERNNPMVSGGVDSWVSNLVGDAITPEWELESSEQKEELKSLWDDSQAQMDFLGFSDFYGIQEVTARSMVRDGEGLSIMHDLPPGDVTASGDPLLVPLQIQPLEADHLDPSYNDITVAGNEIRHSIEWERGRPAAYWIYENHPGERFLTAMGGKRIRIPREDMCHVFRQRRAGQCRGISFFTSVISKLMEIDIYDDAEVVKKKISALWGGFIYDGGSEDTPLLGGTSREKKKKSVPSINLQAGSFPVLEDGQRIAWHDSHDVGQNYDTFLKWQFRMVASGLGITYHQLTGDLSDVNYTSLRAGLIEFRRLCETIVARTLVFQLCRPVVNRWIRTAILNNAVKSITKAEYLANPRLFHRVNWHPDGWDFTDPVKDRIAELMDERNGHTSRRRVAASRNNNVEQIDRENAEDMVRAELLGLLYDSYPKHTNRAGTSQAVEDKVVKDSLELE